MNPVEKIMKLIETQSDISKAMNENIGLIIKNLTMLEERIENLEKKLNK